MILSHELRKRCDECKIEGEREMEKVCRFAVKVIIDRAEHMNKKKIVDAFNYAEKSKFPNRKILKKFKNYQGEI